MSHSILSKISVALLLLAASLLPAQQIIGSGNTGSDVYAETDLAENEAATTVPSFDVTACSNTSPIEVTTSASHGISNGDWVIIQDVTGNTACNGFFEAASVTATTLDLVGSTGDGAYIANGILGGFKAVAGTWVSGNLSNFSASAAGVLTYLAPITRLVLIIHTESSNPTTDPGNPICHYDIFYNGDMSLETVAERNLPSIAAFGSSSGIALLQVSQGDTLQLMVGCVEPSGTASFAVLLEHAALMAVGF